MTVNRVLALLGAALFSQKLPADYTLTPIQFPGATDTYLNGLNDAGQIVGSTSEG